MKKIIVPTLATALTLTAGVSSAATGVTAITAYVRSAPSISSPPIGTIRKGVAVNYAATPENSGWFRLQYKGRRGYIGKKIIVAATKQAKTAAKTEMAPAMPNDIAQPVAKTPMFEIVPDGSAEERRLKNENAKQAEKISRLEAEVSALKNEVAALKLDVQAKIKRVDRYHVMFPYIKVIESVENEGRDVLLNGIGKARMIAIGNRIVFRLEGESLPAAERVMKVVAKERYQVAGEPARIYYVLNSKSVKSSSMN